MSADNFVYVALLDSFLLSKNHVLALDILKQIVEKNMFPDPVDKNYAVIRNAITKLCNDPSTSSNVKTLFTEGGIPKSSLTWGEE